MTIAPGHKPAKKIGDLKFMACPISTITDQTWQILRLVGDCTDDDGNLLHLPFPGSVTQQPEWFLEARRIVKSERADHRQQHLDESKRKAKGQKRGV